MPRALLLSKDLNGKLVVTEASAKVFVANFRGHDFTDALKWGELVPLTDGYVNPVKADAMVHEIATALSESSDIDWFCPSGLLLLNVITAIVFYEMHGQLRLLIHDKKMQKKKDRGENVNVYEEAVITREQLRLILDRVQQLRKAS